MQRIFVSILVFWVTAPFIYGSEGYFGENPGLDFYSKIHEGNASIEKKLVTMKLERARTFGSFGQKCSGIGTLKNERIDEKVLREIQGGYYTNLSKLIRGSTISTDTFQALASCLSANYTKLQTETQKEQSARETVATAGLYLDGDIANSDYDIITDIEKINTIIFSTTTKYTGTKNTASKSLTNLLRGEIPTPLLPISLVIASLSQNPSIPGPSGNQEAPITVGSDTSATDTATLTALLGETCTNNGIVSVIDLDRDSGFLSELESILALGTAPSGISGYSASDRAVALGGNQNPANNTSTPATSASDFFHTMPCEPGATFCIKVKMVPGPSGGLAGGKSTTSIEYILEKFSKHLLPISESSLAYQTMTMNNAEFSIKNLKFAKSLAGMKVYIAEEPQPTRRDKEEMTPEREKAELEEIMNCGMISAGLPTDLARANSIGGAGFIGLSKNTDTKTLDQKPLGAQEAVKMAKYSGCYDTYMAEGRRTYYNSLSTDLTEVQAFSKAMIEEIRDIINILAPMDKKSVK